MPIQIKRVQPGDVIRFQDWNTLAATVESLDAQIEALRQQIGNTTPTSGPSGAVTVGAPRSTTPAGQPIAPPTAEFDFAINVQSLPQAETFFVMADVTPPTLTAEILTASGQIRAATDPLVLAATQGTPYTQSVRVRVDLRGAANASTGSVALRLVSIRSAGWVLQSPVGQFTVGSAPASWLFDVTTSSAIHVPIGNTERVYLNFGDGSRPMVGGSPGNPVVYRIALALPSGWTTSWTTRTESLTGDVVLTRDVLLTATRAAVPTDFMVVTVTNTATTNVVSEWPLPLNN